MTGPARGFSAEEFWRRAAALQDGMAEDGLSALLLTTAADIFYVTGFLTRFWESPTRPWFVIVPAAGAPIAIIPSIGAALMSASWVEDIRTWNALVSEDDGVTLLADALRELPPGHVRLGGR